MRAISVARQGALQRLHKSYIFKASLGGITGSLIFIVVCVFLGKRFFGVDDWGKRN